VVDASDRRVKTRRYQIGRADGTEMAPVMLPSYPVWSFLTDYANAIGMTSLVTPGFNPVP